ncbi:MAG: sulfite exporter TauE/SafE family protein [Nitrosomonadales bacterium]|nr:sulfite exporter TauE/SafE family protein [Nitrosomonadales bacterium]
MIQPDMVVSAPMAATLGFAYGMGPCLISCLPFLGPVFLASDGGIRKSWKIILPLSLGRLTAYSTFGLIVGMLGHYVKDTIANDTVRIVIGCAVLMVGLALLLRKPGSKCDPAQAQSVPLQRMDRRESPKALLPGGLFLMGIGMTLSPCAPLGIVLFSASLAGSAAGGLLLGASFGFGAIVIPALAYGVGMAYLGTSLREQLQNWRPGIERISALLLIAVGIGNLARW